MTNFRTIARRSVAVFLAIAAVVPPAVAQPRLEPQAPRAIVNIAANCYSVGQRVASQSGGTLMSASAERRGGKTVCRIVVRVPGKDGQRPRRKEMVVPAG